MKVEYVAAAFDASGYGEAARNNILALHKAGVDLYLRATSFERNRPELGQAGEFLKTLCRTPDKIDARIVHLTPDLWRAALEGAPPAPTVGYAVWECSKVPPFWVPEINSLAQELWVPSRHNEAAFRDTGVTLPIEVVPHCFPPYSVEPGPRVLPESDHYRFLSVMQWIERKNPGGLLKAYLTEFDANDKVSLVLKTYVKDGSEEERAQIKGWINEVKANLRRASYPRIELITRVLSAGEMGRLYTECDSFVLLHRGEGFGIPIVEAMRAGKHVIATGYGGPADFITPVAVPHTLTPCYGMPWAQYTGDMMWAEPNLASAMSSMRLCSAVRHFVTSRDSVVDRFNYDTVGTQMRTRLEAIVK